LVLCVTPAQAQPAACAALTQKNFSQLPDTPGRIVSSTFIAADANLPAHCDIVGEVAPHVGFGMWLPQPAAWNHKLLAHGCGGFCGIVATPFACTGPLLRGYACIQTDMGHKSTMTDGDWAKGNLPAIVDFAYRSTHVTAVMGKALTQAYYGQPQQHALFMGCSTGGRQGLVEAERFPHDFDGVVSIAPAANETGAGLQLLWSVKANLDAGGKPILSADKMPMLHRAVVEQCDMNDGVKDGLIGDPRLCHFDPSRLLCKGADGPDCLTRPELQAVQKIYAGPSDSHGNRLYTGGLQPGSELNWGHAYLGEHGKPASYAHMMEQFWRYLAFMSEPPPAWNALRDFDWDTDPQRVGGMESLYTGETMDLRKFAAAGGKLLLAQGFYDNSVVPLNTVDFYDGVTRAMGGPAATRRFARFFTIPGMEHCTGGDGAWAIDYLGALDAWVSKGDAPAEILAVHPRPEAVSKLRYLGTNLPLPSGDIAFSRPLFPYPEKAIYAGHGDPTQAGSFVAR
jgi:hypothetical protein